MLSPPTSRSMTPSQQHLGPNCCRFRVRYLNVHWPFIPTNHSTSHLNSASNTMFHLLSQNLRASPKRPWPPPFPTPITPSYLAALTHLSSVPTITDHRHRTIHALCSRRPVVSSLQLLLLHSHSRDFPWSVNKILFLYFKASKLSSPPNPHTQPIR